MGGSVTGDHPAGPGHGPSGPEDLRTTSSPASPATPSTPAPPASPTDPRSPAPPAAPEGGAQTGAPGGHARPPHTRIGRRAGALLVTVAAGVLVGALLNLITVSRVVYSPGPVYDTLGQIQQTPVVALGDGLESYEDTEGHLYFTTIRLQGGPGDELSVWRWIRAELDGSTTVVPRSQVFPEDVTAQQVREQNTALMQHSQEDAAVVALRADGIEVPESVVVAQVIVDAPADGVLHVEDRLLRVGDTEVTNAASVQDRLQEVAPGDSVPMTIVREGEETTIDVPTRQDEESGRTIVGVYLAPQYDLPYDVTIDAGNVGGPSAGLMFSLAVYDKLTPGPLTDGLSVAGTGTISSAAQVGGIGGIKQKMHAAQAAGADLFLAPSANCDEVVGQEPDDLLVVPVLTFDQALDTLEQAGAATDLAELDMTTCQQVLDDPSVLDESPDDD